MITLGQEELTTVLIGISIISFFFHPLQFLFYKLYESLFYVGTFKPTKALQLKDELLIEMLNENIHKKSPSYCITDPDLPDNPIG